MEHTPGPWEAQGETVYQIDGYGLCYLEGKRALVDACLIAAAPDMEKALEDVIRFKVHPQTNDPYFLAAIAALAKARGEVNGS